MQDYRSTPESDPPPSRATARNSMHAAATVTSSSVPPPAAAPSNTGAAFSWIVWLICIIVFLMILVFFVPYFAEKLQFAITRGQERAKAETATTELENLSLVDLSKAYQSVSKRVGPSVVHIRVSGVIDESTPDEFQFLYRWESQQEGSGVIMDRSGYVLTNYHVVKGASEIKVALSDGRTLIGKVVGKDIPTDLALLKVDANKLVAAEWGNSDDLEVGAMVWAIGSPFGLQRSITFGILSAKNRVGAESGGSALQDFLQTDAAVNMGNSGGPLVDARGRVIGINAAILGDSYQGVSFAIPSSVAQGVYERLKSDGFVERGFLGVELQNLTVELARGLGVDSTDGVLVVTVQPQSPAENAGIQIDDVIVRWDGQQITNSSSLVRLVARTKVGSATNVVIIRDGREMRVKVTVGLRSPELP